MVRTGLALLFGFALSATRALSQRSVRITWQASPDAAANPSLVYNVYRASTCAARFSKLNVVGLSSTTYLDMTVGAGAAYCYQVTAMLNGIESAPSNQAVATIPPPSNRQASCEHRGPLIGWIRCIGSRPKKPARETPIP